MRHLRHPPWKAGMNVRGRVLAEGAAAALTVATRRGSQGLEVAWARFTPRQRQTVPAAFLELLRREAAKEMT